MPKRLMPVAMFGALCVACLFSTSAGAREIVKFDASRAFTADEVTLRAELYKPEGAGPFPAVILMHGCGGWQPAVRYTMASYADYLVDHGFAVLNLDSFGPRRHSGGKVCESYSRLRDAREYRTYDAYDAKRFLQAQTFVDADNIFLMGQSNGGSVAIQVAASGDPGPYGRSGQDFRAVVAYYPWCGAFGDGNVTLRSPLLVFGGAKDDWVPPRQCEEIDAEGAELQVKIYPQAAHSFDLEIMPQRYLGKLIGKDQYAAEDSRVAMVAFFMRHLASPSGSSERLAEVAGGTDTTAMR